MDPFFLISVLMWVSTTRYDSQSQELSSALLISKHVSFIGQMCFRNGELLNKSACDVFGGGVCESILLPCLFDLHIFPLRSYKHE